MRIDLLHGLATPREPLASSEFVGGDTLLFMDAVGKPLSRVLWVGISNQTLRVREVRSTAVAGKQYEPADAVENPILFDEVAADLTPQDENRILATYHGNRDRLPVGRHELRLAWTVTPRGSQEQILAVTTHVVRVLPRRPVGTWSDDSPPMPFVDRVLALLGPSPPSDRSAAFEAVAKAVARDPGQILYDQDGDLLAAPPRTEVDAYLDTTGEHPARGNDRAGLVVDLATKCLDRKVGTGTFPVNCHGIAHLMTLIGQLLGLPVERWTVEPTRLRKGLTRLGTGGQKYSPGCGFNSHSVVAWPDHPAQEPRVLDLALYDEDDDGPRWDTLDAYGKKMDLTGSVWRRRSAAVAKPLFFPSLDDLRRRGSSVLAGQIANEQQSGTELWGVYVGRGAPGWARAIWITREGHVQPRSFVGRAVRSRRWYQLPSRAQIVEEWSAVKKQEPPLTVEVRR